MDRLQALMSATWQWLVAVWQKVKIFVIPAIALGFAVAFTFVIVRPFETAEPEEAAVVWNEAIGRLGLQAVYPPEEDIQPGDIWAVIVGADERPLLGRAVRIWRLNLRDDIAAARANAPVFPETLIPAANETPKDQPRIEVAPTPGSALISPTIAAFPGLTVRRTITNRAGFLSRILSFNAESSQAQVEEIRVPVAESYGVGNPNGLLALQRWCNDSQTRPFCSDQFARLMLQYTVDPRVGDKDSAGNYQASIAIMMTTRVFMTRELQVNRIRDSTGSVTGEMGPQVQPPLTGGPSRAADSPTGPVVPPGPAEASARMSRSDTRSFGVTLRQVFPRPVVFGFRGVTITAPVQPVSQGAP